MIDNVSEQPGPTAPSSSAIVDTESGGHLKGDGSALDAFHTRQGARGGGGQGARVGGQGAGFGGTHNAGERLPGEGPGVGKLLGKGVVGDGRSLYSSKSQLSSPAAGHAAEPRGVAGCDVPMLLPLMSLVHDSDGDGSSESS